MKTVGRVPWIRKTATSYIHLESFPQTQIFDLQSESIKYYKNKARFRVNVNYVCSDKTCFNCFFVFVFVFVFVFLFFLFVCFLGFFLFCFVLVFFYCCLLNPLYSYLIFYQDWESVRQHTHIYVPLDCVLWDESPPDSPVLDSVVYNTYMGRSAKN